MNVSDELRVLLRDPGAARWGERVEAVLRLIDAAQHASSIECPCCGREAANWIVDDGDPLACGCDGYISADGEMAPYAVADDCDCEGDGKS